MTKRKILYGYQIRGGALEIVPEEQRVVQMLFALYSAGASYQDISDALNRQGVPYSSEIPLWNKHKIKRMLENARYTGKDGYPVMIAETDFQAVQDKISEKNDRRQVSEEVTVVDRLKPYFRCTCGGKMVRLGGRWQDRSKVYLKCEHCGISVSLDTDETFQEVAHQMQTHECQEADAYVPSAEVIRLNNAINRGLEQPDSPEAVMALILQGAAARYDCCPQPISECEPSDCPVEVDWLRFRRVVSYITVASDATVSLTFTDDTMGQSYRGNIEGSDPRHSFHYLGGDDTLYVFEAPIDLLSYISLFPEGWQAHNYVACCGTSSIPVMEMLRQLPQLRQVYLCLDNDAAGHAASERMAKLLEERGISAERLVPQQKDWNDDLKAEQENKMERSALCQTFC